MTYEDLMEKAKEASKNSYSPYSNFPVGACLQASSGKTYIGTNVENSSFGATICAERSAIVNAVVNGEREIEAIAIYGAKMKMCAPCGPCRQVIAEFKSKSKGTKVILEAEDGSLKVFDIDELLPLGFEL
ncbi:cytidine deaminase [bacterium]|nr:cytidine deaminase [bacterium]